MNVQCVVCLLNTYIKCDHTLQPVEAVTENCVRLTDIRAQCMQIFRMSERVYVCVCVCVTHKLNANEEKQTTAIGDKKIDNEEPISIKNLIKHTKFT